ncbi:MAG: hypothetical protein ACXWJK_16345 [Burkholderiaceae bacterium]
MRKIAAAALSLLAVRVYYSRRDPCRTYLRLRAQTVMQACNMLHEFPAAPLLQRFCVSPMKVGSGVIQPPERSC